MKKLILSFEVLLQFMGHFVIAVIQVASWVFRPNSKMKPAIVRMQVEIKNQWGLWILSLFIFLVPGSMIVDIRRDRNQMYVHFFHTDDPDQSIAYIKEVFEKKLRIIFGEIGDIS